MQINKRLKEFNRVFDLKLINAWLLYKQNLRKDILFMPEFPM